MRKFWFLKMITIAVIAVSGLSFVVMLLWNELVPDLFKGPLISFPQALGLFILIKILFRGLGWHRGHHWKHNHWRQRMEEKMNAMTPEEREKFREQWKQRCGRFGRWGQPVSGGSESKPAE
jgi:hypothetical protein